MDESDTREIELSRAEARAIIAGLSDLDTRAGAATDADHERVMNLQQRFEEEFGFERDGDDGDDPYTGDGWILTGS